MLEQGINIWGGEQFAPLFGDIKRFLTSLQSSLSQHYTIPSVTLTGDYNISWKALHPSTPTGNQSFIAGSGGVDGDQFTLYKDATNALQVQYPVTAGNNYDLRVDTSTLTVGHQYDHNITKVGTTITITVGTLSDSETRGDWESINISDIGSFNNGLFIDNIISDLKITDGSTLTHDLAFDEDFGTTSIAVNKGTLGAAGNATAVNITESELFCLVDGDWLGVELTESTFLNWANRPSNLFDNFIASSTSLEISNNTAKTSVASHPDNIQLIDGVTYLIEMSHTAPLGVFEMSLRTGVGGPNFGIHTITGTSTTFTAVATTATDGVIQVTSRTGGAANSIVINDISVKRLIEVAP